MCRVDQDRTIPSTAPKPDVPRSILATRIASGDSRPCGCEHTCRVAPQRQRANEHQESLRYGPCTLSPPCVAKPEEPPTTTVPVDVPPNDDALTICRDKHIVWHGEQAKHCILRPPKTFPSCGRPYKWRTASKRSRTFGCTTQARKYHARTRRTDKRMHA